MSRARIRPQCCCWIPSANSAALFGLADCVFMGGTLAARGGHNILEPALFGKPVIVGPHMENFQAIADEFRAARAVVEVGGRAELAGAVERVLADDGGVGERARECAEARRGATARAVAAMREIYRVPRYRPAMPWYAVGMAALARVALGGAAPAGARLCAPRARWTCR